VINRRDPGHSCPVILSALLSLAAADGDARAVGATDAQRITEMFQAHNGVVWRSLRRLGVAPGAVDDATQEVFVVALRRLGSIEAGKERAFLLGTAVRVAADARRGAGRRREHLGDDPPELPDLQPRADEQLDQARARALLDEITASMPEGTEAIFVLHELEGLTMAEIASALALAPGTVASRLRRARKHFEAEVARRAVGRKHV
jgi:RNA polymerase sigma-70 factor (ECF subfamily)